MRTIASLLLPLLAIPFLFGGAGHAGDDRYAGLLKKTVKADGVDYATLRKERSALDAFVSSLAKASPGKETNEKLAFWINAYNALTLQQVLDTRPAKGRYSVKEVDGFWTKRKWTVAGREVTLDDIEHKILRREFEQPLIHFAINCASRSCPKLSAHLYEAGTLEYDLTQAARAYLADDEQNHFDEARVRADLSQLFLWFKGDFVMGVHEPVPGVPRLQQFLAQYAPRESLRRRLLGSRFYIRFKKYDWSLNESGARRVQDKRGGSPLLWVYLVPAALLLLYGLHSFRVLVLRRRNGRRYHAQLDEARRSSPLGRTEFPRVLLQLPVYNEREVVQRVIDAAAALDYPPDRLEIQVLDDSTDETVALVDRAARRHPGIRVLRRRSRQGFKAGALQEGLSRSDAGFVAILDADFVPPRDFLKRALVHFDDAGVGCVQGRWAHLNRDQNWLTRAQAIGLDAHFFVIQFTRAASGSFHNFMGTAGIWRRAAIDDAGGWSGDTLTEDLDLSYRAQLRGWRIVLDPELAVPAEIPPTVGAYKSQQRRWACGSIQCARKHLPAVWRHDLPLRVKLEATLHLCGYGVCLAMALLVVLLPWADVPALWPLGVAGLGPLAVSVAGQGRLRPGPMLSFFMLGVGTSVSNAVAVLRGLTRPIATFVRTPKQGTRNAPQRTPAPLLEQSMAIFTLACVFSLAERAPVSMATSYWFFCSAGFCALTAYWWMVERNRGEP